MCCCYTGSPEPEPETLFDRILSWGQPAALIAPAVAAVALAVMTAIHGPSLSTGPVVYVLLAGVIYIVLLLPVGIAAGFVMLVVAALAAVTQATWSALRR